MPSITVSYRDLCGLLGKRVEQEKLCNRLSMMGVWAEAAGDEIKLEVSHNRPDLLSSEGVARALKGFLGIKMGLPNYRLRASGVTVDVDRSVESIRPYIAAGVVTSVKLTDNIVTSLMQVQEKLHSSLCRNRRKGSIGVYDLDTITPPIRYTTTLPNDIRFVPLDFNQEMTPAQILRKHPKGIEYGSTIQDLPRYPLLTDSRGIVLSMPPIINSEDTRITDRVKKFFIDVTGLNERVVNTTLVILMTSLAERGFKLQSVAVNYPGRRVRTPDLSPNQWRLSTSNTNKLIGLKLGSREIVKTAERMRYGVTKPKGDILTLLTPPYRTDIMHEVDLIEDMAVGYGYDRLEPTLPKVLTIGGRAPIEKVSDNARRVLTGLGFMEVMTYTLTNPHVNFELMQTKGDVAEIANPVSEEYTMVRNSLLPPLLSTLQENRRNPLPQQIFEVGGVVVLDENAETGAMNIRRAAAAVIGDNIGFTYIKAVAEALLRELGVAWEVRTARHPSFLDGRAAELVVGGKHLGIVGEIHPKVILGFELAHPIAVFEVDLE